MSSHLQYINDSILSGFSRGAPSQSVPNELRWTEPVSNVVSYCFIIC